MGRGKQWVGVAALLGVATLAGCSGGNDLVGSGAPSTADGELAKTPGDTTPGPPGDVPDGFGAGPAGHGVDRFYHQRVQWKSCDGGAECADIWVPLDYSDPDGQAITLRAKRELAGDASRRRGSLFINPGGPGVSGIAYLDYISLDSSITAVYDVVGFDPRGVGTSTPVDCVSDADLDAFIASDPSPDDPAEVKEFEDLFASFAAGCRARSGPLLEHVSTVEVAKDLDVLRAVVGDQRLNYFGASYGTYIGAMYAALFPGEVDRMVLDGAVDPLATPRASELGQAAGFDDALTAYLNDCVSQGGCPLGDDVASARSRLIDLFREIDQTPLKTSSDRELTEGLAFLGVIWPLYDEASWSLETRALGDALDGRGDALMILADAYSQRLNDGSYPSNALEAQPAVNCLDHPEHESITQIEADGARFIEAAPVFGSVAQWWPYTCSAWPVKPSEPQPDFSAPGAAPIVVVGTTRDPATPYEQAVRLADELDSGVLLSRDGDGHTAYGRGNPCIDTAINTYLVEGLPPADGASC